jgi:Rrf2 family transcriptional regulator, nitric oxide-sensitive transcriptional repressor
VTTQEKSGAYGISKHHLVRVIHTLAGRNYVGIQPGRPGGVRLAREPRLIAVGDVIRDSEPNLRLVECFDRQTNTCPIAPVCSLKGKLNEVLSAFLDSLNRYTIADVLQESGRPQLVSVFAQVGQDSILRPIGNRPGG